MARLARGTNTQEPHPPAPGGPDVTVGPREKKNSRTARRQNGRWVRPTSTRRRSTAGVIKTAKGRSEPHGRRRVPKGNRPGRDNSPTRGPGTCAEGKAATNDPRGRRLHCHLNAIGDARRQKPQGRVRTTHRRRGRRQRGARTNAAAGWSGGRMPPRRNGAASERRRDAKRETSREVADRPVRRERGGRQPTGPVEDGGPASTRPRVPRAPDRLAHFSEQVFMGRERLEKREPKRARTLRRAPQRKTDADGTHR